MSYGGGSFNHFDAKSNPQPLRANASAGQNSAGNQPQRAKVAAGVANMEIETETPSTGSSSWLSRTLSAPATSAPLGASKRLSDVLQQAAQQLQPRLSISGAQTPAAPQQAEFYALRPNDPYSGGSAYTGPSPGVVSPPHSAGPHKKALFDFTSTSDVSRRTPRDPRANGSRSSLGDAFPQSDAGRPYSSQSNSVNPYAAMARQPDENLSANATNLATDFANYRNIRNDASYATYPAGTLPEPRPSSSVMEDTDDSVMSVLKKIGVGPDIMDTIRGLKGKTSTPIPTATAQPAQPTPPPQLTQASLPAAETVKTSPKAPQISARSSSVTSPANTFYGVDLTPFLPSSRGQQLDAENVAGVMSQIIASLPAQLQEQLATNQEMLKAFQTIIYNNVKSTVTAQSAQNLQQRCSFSDPELDKMAVDRRLKSDRLKILKEEENKLMAQQRDIIKEMTKQHKLIEANPLLMANMDILSYMQNAAKEVSQEIRELENHMGAARASQPVASEVVAAAKQQLFKHRVQSGLENPTCRYVDAGSHWCKTCNELFDDLPGFLAHVSSQKHIAAYGCDKFPQLNSEINKEGTTNRMVDHLTIQPLRGCEFIVPVTQTYHCNLCKVFANGFEAVERHLTSQTHHLNLANYEEDHPGYEKLWEMNKAFRTMVKTGRLPKSFIDWRGLSLPPASVSSYSDRTRRGRSRSRSRSRSNSRQRRDRSRSRSRSPRSRRQRSRSTSRRRSRSPIASRRRNASSDRARFTRSDQKSARNGLRNNPNDAPPSQDAYMSSRPPPPAIVSTSNYEVVEEIKH